MLPWYWSENGQPERTEPFTWNVEGGHCRFVVARSGCL